MRFYDPTKRIVYWYHGIDVKGTARTRSSLPSSATTMTPSRPTSRSTRWRARSRPTASPATRDLRDAEMTMDLFERFYLDKERGGYFSHIDPITLDPRGESLGHNRARRTGTRSATTRPPT